MCGTKMFLLKSERKNDVEEQQVRKARQSAEGESQY
jgi:hypothetical protein